VKKRTNNFLNEISNLLFFWIIGIIFFFFSRLTVILIYNFDLSENLEINEFFKTFFMGFRFDTTVVSYFLLIPFLCIYILPIFKKEKYISLIRVFFQYLFAITSTLVCVININYYKEFKDQFNHFLLLGLFDDKKAVFQSILNDFNPLISSVLIILIALTIIKIFKYFENKKGIYNFLNFKNKIILLKVLFLLLFIASIRGSFNEYPARRFYSSVSSDNFLNKTIINPIRALNNAISDFNELNRIENENPYGKASVKVEEKFQTFKQVLEKNTENDNLNKQPEQVFLVVMESYDSWPLKEDYKSLGVSKNLKKIEEKGVSFKNFIPSANTTMNSLAAIISGVPYCGINISKIGASRLFESSIFTQFKKLGYETNIFFTTYSSWQNLGNFAKGQGVDNVYDGTSSPKSKGIWGINDESLFENVLEKIDINKKSLNIILTISYHSPYEENVFSKGFNLDVTNSNINYNNKILPPKVLGHLWFADKSIGDFVRKADEKYKNSLFAFTGDHYSRKFINNSPTLKERSSVPFILYGSALSYFPEKNYNPGSHIDISPTLINLIAPKGFTYYSFGSSLLDNKKNKKGIGFDKIIKKNVLFEFSKNYGTKKEIFTNTLIDNKSEFLNKKSIDSLMSLAWHYTIKGDSIK
jgi:phosphoglycerol transferase MdoB-like AlkP superfamily enzyme|tara:strand:+ start:152 stop:2077 length:1926 start_codon:yes stop_codon:yes gene_type:complete